MADLARRHQHGRRPYGWDVVAAADLAPNALTMPPGFLFGAATAAHQVEGFHHWQQLGGVGAWSPPGWLPADRRWPALRRGGRSLAPV
ncbi:MAG: hypothetical protein LC721_13180 [Actinobacteria bacterium]|nr:hypothetical protein [Actinomycetota bacterium]